jgi:hypothetical protein
MVRTKVVQLKEYLKDKYLTWNTGKDKATREWEAWYKSNVVYNANDITNMFMHFEHVIIVDVKKFMDPYEPMAWVPNKEAREYFWPARPLGENCVWRFERVRWDKWDNRWHIDEFGGEERVFVATNSGEDATMLALRYA